MSVWFGYFLILGPIAVTIWWGFSTKKKEYLEIVCAKDRHAEFVLTL